MASILAKNNSQYLREVFRVVESYDLEKLLNDAVTSLIISSRERKEIVDHVHSKTEMWDKFQKLVLERGRLTDFVSFILDYDNRVHRRVQDAAVGLALSVLSLRQTSEEYLPNSDSPEDSPPSSPSKSYSPSQMDPADTDANKDFYFQEGDMHPPDIGYCSDLSKDISQDQSRYCNVGSNSPQPVCWQEKSMLMKKYPREKVPSGNRKRYSNKRSVQQLHKGQSTSPPTPRRNEDVDDEISTTMKETVQKRSSYSWPPPHHEALIQNLNIQALLPHLLSNQLLTQDEYEEIARFKDIPTEQNRHFSLVVLPRKGQSAHEKLVKSLKSETTHLGHRDLVKLLAT